MTRETATLLFALAALAAGFSSAHAQEAEDAWSGQASLQGNLFFGNTRLTTILTRAGVERADSVTEFSSSAELMYGETSNDAGETSVLRRSWRVLAGADFNHTSKISPFVFGSLERSLQARLDSRLFGGAGIKLAFIRDEVTRLDFSPAVLAERTDPRVSGVATDDVTTLVRGSFRFRVRRDLDGGRLRLSAVTFYRPKLTDWGVFTLDFEARLDLRVSQRITINFLLTDRYDSEAEDRGARSNNDGHLLVGLTTQF